MNATQGAPEVSSQYIQTVMSNCVCGMDHSMGDEGDGTCPVPALVAEVERLRARAAESAL